MGRPCLTCKHSLEEEIHDRFLAGVSFRKIGRAYGLSHSSAFRHLKNRHFERRRGLPVIYAPRPFMPTARREATPPLGAAVTPSGGVVGAFQRALLRGLMRR